MNDENRAIGQEMRDLAQELGSNKIKKSTVSFRLHEKVDTGLSLLVFRLFLRRGSVVADATSSVASKDR